jgi:hypothetical protein
MNLPVFFIISATMVDSKEKLKPLLIALFLGSIVSAIEHFMFVRFNIDISGGSIAYARTISFLSPGIFFSIAILIWMPKLNPRDKLIIIISCIIFVISTLLNQTRSIWLSTVAALIVALLLFNPKKLIVKIFTFPTILTGFFICVLVTTGLLFPEIDLVQMIIDRLAGLKTQYYSFTRLLSFKLEMNAWWNGSLIFGRGLWFFSEYTDSTIIAWGHLGHVTILSQLGIIGLVVYSFYLPATIIRASMTLWKHETKETKFFGLLAGIIMIFYWICFIMSDSFLSQHMVGGIIFGAVWRQAKLIKSQKVITTQ